MCFTYTYILLLKKINFEYFKKEQYLVHEAKSFKSKLNRFYYKFNYHRYSKWLPFSFIALLAMGGNQLHIHQDICCNGNTWLFNCLPEFFKWWWFLFLHSILKLRCATKSCFKFLLNNNMTIDILCDIFLGHPVCVVYNVHVIMFTLIFCCFFFSNEIQTFQLSIHTCTIKIIHA